MIVTYFNRIKINFIIKVKNMFEISMVFKLNNKVIHTETLDASQILKKLNKHIEEKLNGITPQLKKLFIEAAKLYKSCA